MAEKAPVQNSLPGFSIEKQPGKPQGLGIPFWLFLLPNSLYNSRDHSHCFSNASHQALDLPAS